MRNDPKRVGHAEEKEKKEAKAIWPCVGAKAKQRAIRPFWCEFHREQNTTESFSLRRCSPCEEIDRNTVTV